METVKILIACHKPDSSIRKDDIYMPIQVGKALNPELNLGFQCDNTGDNISDKNNSYCELTALYWAWKNLKNVDYIGLAHYRRYFKMEMTPQNIINILRRNDIICIKDQVYPISVYRQLVYLLTMEDVDIMIDTLLELHPEMKQVIIDYFYRNNKFSQLNMMIANWEIFDHYCSFIFPILNRIENRLLPHKYVRLVRILGYMSEALLGLWIRYNNLKVIYVDRDEGKQYTPLITPLKELVLNIRKNVFFYSTRRPHTPIFYSAVEVGLRQNGIILSHLKGISQK